MIDYLVLMLMGLVAGLATVAWFFWKGPADPESKGIRRPLCSDRAAGGRHGIVHGHDLAAGCSALG